LRRITLLAAVLLLCSALPGTAQMAPQPALQPVPPAADTAAISPRGALIRSLVIPGWGQSYVGAPGRGAVYFGLEAGSLFMVYKSRRQLAAARDRQAFLRETGALPEDDRLDLVRSRERQVEDWITLAVFFALFAGADAYVAAQLADFDERFGVRPAAGGGLQLETHIPLRRR
jgi:hypothetical protein